MEHRRVQPLQHEQRHPRQHEVHLQLLLLEQLLMLLLELQPHCASGCDCVRASMACLMAVAAWLQQEPGKEGDVRCTRSAAKGPNTRNMENQSK